jgi:hypothetical protein
MSSKEDTPAVNGLKSSLGDTASLLKNLQEQESSITRAHSLLEASAANPQGLPRGNALINEASTAAFKSGLEEFPKINTSNPSELSEQLVSNLQPPQPGTVRKEIDNIESRLNKQEAARVAEAQQNAKALETERADQAAQRAAKESAAAAQAATDKFKRGLDNFQPIQPDNLDKFSKLLDNLPVPPPTPPQPPPKLPVPAVVPAAPPLKEYIHLNLINPSEKDTILKNIKGISQKFKCTNNIYISRIVTTNTTQITAWLCYKYEKKNDGSNMRNIRITALEAINDNQIYKQELLNNFIEKTHLEIHNNVYHNVYANVYKVKILRILFPLKTAGDESENNLSWILVRGEFHYIMSDNVIKALKQLSSTLTNLIEISKVNNKGTKDDPSSIEALKNALSSLAKLNSKDTDDSVLGATTTLASVLATLAGIKLIDSPIPRGDKIQETQTAALDSLNKVIDLLRKIGESDRKFGQDPDVTLSINGLLGALKNLIVLKPSSPARSPDTTTEPLVQLQKVIAALLSASTKKSNLGIKNAINQFTGWINGHLNTLYPSKKILDPGSLTKIKANVLETLELLGEPFEQRGDRRFQELAYLIDPGNESYLGNSSNLIQFNLNMKRAEKAIKRQKDKQVKLLNNFVQLNALDQDPYNPNRTITNFQSLNDKLEAAGLSNFKIVPNSKSGGGNETSLEIMNQYNLPLTGGNLPNLNEYNIRIEGGAPEEAKPADNPNSPQKVFERIQELKIQLNKVKVFIEQEVKPKYENYKTQIFNKIFANSNNDLQLINDQSSNIYVSYTPAEKSGDSNNPGKPPQDERNIVGLYNTIADGENGKNKWLEDIKKKITENRTSLEKIRNEYLEIADLPEIKSLNIFPSYKTEVKNAFDGNFNEKPKDSVGNTIIEPTTGIITRLDNISKTLQARFDAARSALKPVADGFTSALTSYEKLNQKIYNPVTGKPYGGGGEGIDGLIWNGGDEDKVLDEITNFISKNYTRVTDVTDKKIEEQYKRLINPAYLVSATSTPGIWGNILAKYKTDTFNEGALVATKRLTSSLKANNINPTDVLKISSTDRLIFAAVMIFLRALTIQITEYYIAKGTINTISMALIVFTIIYSALFLILVVYVNLDAYRLRILFNYINLNGNSGVIMMHLGLLYLLTYGIFMIIRNVNFPVSKMKNTAVTDEELAYLMYQLEIITTIVWLFLLILVAFL